MSQPNPHPDGDRTPAGGRHHFASRRAAVEFEALMAAGDSARAFELLQSRTGKLRGHLLRRYARSLGGEVEVETHVTAAVLRALDRGEDFEASRAPRGLDFWLFTIGVRLVLDHLQSERARRTREQRAAEVAGTGAAEDPMARDRERRRRDELGSQVREVIERLPQPGRRILLRDLEAGGRAPVVELAMELGLAEQTVLNLRVQARRRFRELYEATS